jgi:transcriptional regulator with XRE-family HTH domain
MAQKYEIIDTKKTVKQYEIEERQKQITIMVAQGMTQIEIGQKLGVDNSTISKDIKAMKLISQQFIYDIRHSDFTFYYKQNMELVQLVLRKQLEIIEKDKLDSQDLAKWRILSEFLTTIETLHGYYKATRHSYGYDPTEIALIANEFKTRPEAPKPKPREKLETVEDEIKGVEADLEYWYGRLEEAKKESNELEIDDVKGYIVEHKDQLETIRNETPEERKKRIKTEGYFTDWMLLSDKEEQIKKDAIV